MKMMYYYLWNYLDTIVKFVLDDKKINILVQLNRYLTDLYSFHGSALKIPPNVCIWMSICLCDQCWFVSDFLKQQNFKFLDEKKFLKKTFFLYLFSIFIGWNLNWQPNASALLSNLLYIVVFGRIPPQWRSWVGKRCVKINF